MALVKTIKDRLTDDTIYPIAKADAVYLSDNETTVESALGDLSTISSIENGTVAGAISTLDTNLKGLWRQVYTKRRYYCRKYKSNFYNNKRRIRNGFYKYNSYFYKCL